MPSLIHDILYVADYRPTDKILRLPVRKVGISGKGNSTVDSRMNQLSNGTEAYAPIFACQAYKFLDEHSASDAETYLHKLFDRMELRTNPRREWFNGKFDNESNLIEEEVKSYIDSLKHYGVNIIDLLENMTPGQEETVITEDNEQIILKAADESTWNSDSPWVNNIAKELQKIYGTYSNDVTLRYTKYRLFIVIDGKDSYNLRTRKEPDAKLHIMESDNEKLEKIKTLLDSKGLEYTSPGNTEVRTTVDMDLVKNTNLIREIHSIRK